MRHYKKGRKLGTDASHTNAIKKNLVVGLFTNDRIKTTLERAKEIRGDVDRVITWAKRGDVHSRRLAIAKLGDKQLVSEIFAKVEQGMFKDRPGGYSRIIRLGTRRGDSATIVIMELVQEPYIKKVVKEVEAKPARRVIGRRGTDKAADKADKAVDKAKGKKQKEEAAVVADEDLEIDEFEDVLDIEAVEVVEDVEEAAAEEAAAEEAAAEEAPAEEAAAEEAPEVAEVVEVAEEAPAEEGPVEEAPAEETAKE